MQGQSETRKMVAGIHIFNAVAEQAYIATRRYQVESKPVVRYTGMPECNLFRLSLGREAGVPLDQLGLIAPTGCPRNP
jgi:hypothetical protein